METAITLTIAPSDELKRDVILPLIRQLFKHKKYIYNTVTVHRDHLEFSQTANKVTPVILLKSQMSDLIGLQSKASLVTTALILDAWWGRWQPAEETDFLALLKQHALTHETIVFTRRPKRDGTIGSEFEVELLDPKFEEIPADSPFWAFQEQHAL